MSIDDDLECTNSKGNWRNASIMISINVDLTQFIGLTCSHFSINAEPEPQGQPGLEIEQQTCNNNIITTWEGTIDIVSSRLTS